MIFMKRCRRGQSLSDLINDNVKLQQKLTQQQLKADVDYLLNNNSNTIRDRARLHSLSGKGAGAWVSAILSSSRVALSSHDFCLATMIRLGCDILASSSCCDCGKELDIQGYHLITCKTAGGPVHTHNSIVSAWSNCLSQLNLPHKLEPQYRYVNSDKRSDILVYDPDSGADIELDVSLAHA